jgi:hypothetical protein
MAKGDILGGAIGAVGMLVDILVKSGKTVNSVQTNTTTFNLPTMDFDPTLTKEWKLGILTRGSTANYTIVVDEITEISVTPEDGKVVMVITLKKLGYSPFNIDKKKGFEFIYQRSDRTESVVSSLNVRTRYVSIGIVHE